MTALLVGLGALLGAPLRYLVDRAIRSRQGGLFPFGTLSVNLGASVVLGVLAGAAGSLGDEVHALVGTGFCGALSTYSTFAHETLRLAEHGARPAAVVNVVGGVVAGLAAAGGGWWLGAALA